MYNGCCHYAHLAKSVRIYFIRYRKKGTIC
nr:unnamed protein product [Callosobruchus analis]